MERKLLPYAPHAPRFAIDQLTRRTISVLSISERADFLTRRKAFTGMKSIRKMREEGTYTLLPVIGRKERLKR
jgi:hypothetical protein